jgi:hypothetical protein
MKLKTKFIIATLLLAIFIVNMIWWFRVSGSNNSFEIAKDNYLSAFPGFLQNTLLLTGIAIAFLVISGIFFVQTRKQNRLKTVSTVGFCLSFTLAFWQLFSLM